MSKNDKLYLTEKEASHRYGFSVHWFQRSRWNGSGPSFIKINGGRVLYPMALTDEWFANFPLYKSTSEASKIDLV